LGKLIRLIGEQIGDEQPQRPRHIQLPSGGAGNQASRDQGGELLPRRGGDHHRSFGAKRRIENGEPTRYALLGLAK
jgi:hypothetical protein